MTLLDPPGDGHGIDDIGGLAGGTPKAGAAPAAAGSAAAAAGPSVAWAGESLI
jgi:hypothetical protein